VVPNPLFHAFVEKKVRPDSKVLTNGTKDLVQSITTAAASPTTKGNKLALATGPAAPSSLSSVSVAASVGWLVNIDCDGVLLDGAGDNGAKVDVNSVVGSSW